ncbi:hypothetical protein ACFL27_07405 [candidate division CSSED10-310 bacterium]|uniref:CopG family transcriptional regulator n=1 Tax=candidate division CSSED10-310 bacterium TaxID=2855610 RepID=A0ABV6YUW9_UNCC1
MSFTIEENKIKDLFKQALVELFQERREFIHDLLAEFIEDYAMINAIKEGENTENVTKDEVFEILEGAS